MTFDVPLFVLLTGSAVVAIILVVPKLVKGLVSDRSDIRTPVPIVVAGATVQQALLAAGLAAAGTAVAPRVGLDAPWFAAVSHGEGLALGEAAAQLPAALIVGGISTVVFLILYYRVIRPRMAMEDIARTEGFRSSMGLFGRLLMGGVVEEVMFRWGVMSLAAWLFISVLDMTTLVGMWLAIVVAGLLFGLAHLPGVMAVGVKITKTILAAAIGLNMVVALACGWLFWQHGLLAAMIAHALLHAVWRPFERGATDDRGPSGDVTTHMSHNP